MLPNLSKDKYKHYFLISLFSFGFLHIPFAYGANGYYPGNWAADLQECRNKNSSERIYLDQFSILSPEYSCKLVGMRERTEYSVTFKAACKDQNVKWNDEITIQPNGEILILTMQSDGHDKTFFKCP